MRALGEDPLLLGEEVDEAAKSVLQRLSYVVSTTIGGISSEKDNILETPYLMMS